MTRKKKQGKNAEDSWYSTLTEFLILLPPRFRAPDSYLKTAESRFHAGCRPIPHSYGAPCSQWKACTRQSALRTGYRLYFFYSSKTFLFNSQLSIIHSCCARVKCGSPLYFGYFLYAQDP